MKKVPVEEDDRVLDRASMVILSLVDYIRARNEDGQFKWGKEHARGDDSAMLDVRVDLQWLQRLWGRIFNNSKESDKTEKEERSRNRFWCRLTRFFFCLGRLSKILLHVVVSCITNRANSLKVSVKLPAREESIVQNKNKLHSSSCRIVVGYEPFDRLIESCFIVLIASVSDHCELANGIQESNEPSSKGVNSKSGKYLTSLALEAVFLYCPSALVVSY